MVMLIQFWLLMDSSETGKSDIMEIKVLSYKTTTLPTSGTNVKIL